MAEFQNTPLDPADLIRVSRETDGSGNPSAINYATLAAQILGGAVLSYAVADLPAGAAGQFAQVTDGDAALAWGDIAVNSGAGATPYLVWYNGTDWTVVGK